MQTAPDPREAAAKAAIGRLKVTSIIKSLKGDWRLVAAAQAMRRKEFVDEFDAALALGKTIKQRREVEHWSKKLEELEQREESAAPAGPAAPPAAPAAPTASASLDEDSMDAPLTPSLISRMQSLGKVDAAAPLRDGMHVQPAWIAETAPDLSNLESSQLQTTPQGNHATRSLRAALTSPGGSLHACEDTVSYTFPPAAGEPESAQKRRNDRHRRREEVVIRKMGEADLQHRQQRARRAWLQRQAERELQAEVCAWLDEQLRIVEAREAERAWAEYHTAVEACDAELASQLAEVEAARRESWSCTCGLRHSTEPRSIYLPQTGWIDRQSAGTRADDCACGCTCGRNERFERYDAADTARGHGAAMDTLYQRHHPRDCAARRQRAAEQQALRSALAVASASYSPSEALRLLLDDSRAAFVRSGGALFSQQSVGQEIDVSGTESLIAIRKPRSSSLLQLELYHDVVWACPSCSACYCFDVFQQHQQRLCRSFCDGSLRIVEVEAAIPGAWVRISTGERHERHQHRHRDLWFQNPPLSPLDRFAPGYRGRCRHIGPSEEMRNEEWRRSALRTRVRDVCEQSLRPGAAGHDRSFSNPWV